MRKTLATALILACALGAVAWAQMMDSQPVVSSKSFSRDFGGSQVDSQFTLRAGGVFDSGQRVWLQVDLDSAAGGSVRAAVINGFIVFALPPGLEADGQPRLLYYNAETGRYDYMYSKAYPRLDRLAGSEAAFADAASNDPSRILAGLTQVSLALDSSVNVVKPASPRLMGSDRAYSLTGVSWLLPANVYMKPIVNLFDPEPGLATGAKLRAVLQVKVTGEVGALPVEVYAGGLSAAMHEMDLLPSQLPESAIPLAPVPEASAPAAVEPVDTATVEQPEEEPEPETQPAREGTPVQQPPTRSHNSRHPSEPPVPSSSQDEQPANDSAGTTPPPQPIPAMVYSHVWLSWETQYTPSADVPSPGNAPAQLEQANPAGESGSGQFEMPEENAPAQLPPTTALNEKTVASEESSTPAQSPEKTPEIERPVRQPESTPAASSENSSARQVTPGTLPDEPQEYTVPLKEIEGSASSSSPSGSPEFRLKPAGESTGGSAGGTTPGVITPELPGAQMNLPAPEGLGEMILIPAGPFLMGTASGQGGDADEQPQSEVNLPAYYIDKYPVTNRQFHNFVISAGFKPDGNWQKYYGPGTADLPVRGVSFADAQAFAKWAGKRLPTEAEWEKAARGTDGRTYPWGEEWSSDIMPRGDETAMYAVMTAPKTASPYGVMGMSGLVWQWTSSPYASYPFDPEARSEKYVLRGGAYSNGRGVIRCANRYYEPVNVALNTFGFRCVKDAPGA